MKRNRKHLNDLVYVNNCLMKILSRIDADDDSIYRLESLQDTIADRIAGITGGEIAPGQIVFKYVKGQPFTLVQKIGEEFYKVETE